MSTPSRLVATIAACTVCAVLPLPCTAGAQQATPPVPLATVMSPADRAATGIDSLSPARREALEAWLARYTAIVTGTARTLSAESARVGTVARREARLDRESRGGGSFAAGALLPVGSRIAGIVRDGEALVLENGTLWEVAPTDRPRADGWERGDFVRIERVGAPNGDYEWRLVHGADDDQAVARFGARLERERR
jgi:hypothetical protein